MGWQLHLDNYCERLSSAFWAEPVNALSNVAFLIAALMIWRMQRRVGASTPVSINVLVPLMMLIGAGSFVFHTVATAWSQVLDVAPIGLFVCYYIALYFRWLWLWKWNHAWLGVLLFVGFCAATVAVFGSRSVNGSLPYIPVLVTLVGLTVALALSGEPERATHWRAFALAAAVFTGALFFRTMDFELCSRFSLGTHFLWHILNGAVLFVLCRALVGRWRQLGQSNGVPSGGWPELPCRSGDPGPRPGI